ncbi:unnamed protein product, partial [Pylaiella littoralis]
STAVIPAKISAGKLPRGPLVVFKLLISNKACTCLTLFHFHGSGATASTNAGGNRCKQTFPPKKPSLRKLSPIPTVYLRMTTTSFYKEFKDIFGFKQACKVPLGPDANGRAREGYKFDFPSFNHFVPLLPSADAADHQAR